MDKMKSDVSQGELKGMPQLTGSLQGLKVLGTDDLAPYKAAVEDGQQMGWKYYFPYLLSRHKAGKRAVLCIEDEGSMCLFLWQIRDTKPRLDIFVAPTPMNVPVLKRCIARANEFNRDLSARVMRIDAGDVDAVSVAGIRVGLRKRQYIYAPDEYESLGGKRYYTIRRNVALIERLPDVQMMPYTPSHAQACRALLARWSEAHRETHGTSGGVSISKRAIDLAGVLPGNILCGEVVFVDGNLVAFAFGGEIRSGLACSFERKCDTDIRGLSYFQLRSFLRSLQDFSLVNDGSDAGRPGLHQLKESFRPVAMHEEYRGKQHRSSRRRTYPPGPVMKSKVPQGKLEGMPQLTGSLQGLKILGADDLAPYKAAVETGQQMGWDYYFPFLLSSHRAGKRAVLCIEDEGSMCIFHWQIRDTKPRLDVFLAPTPMNVPVLRRCIERANDYNRDRSARVMRIDAKDVDAVSVAGIRVSPRRSQYIYAPGGYVNLGGKKYRGIRSSVSLIQRSHDIEVTPYVPSHATACRKLLARWRKVYREVHGTSGGASYSASYSKQAIDLAGGLLKNVLRGEVVFIDGILAAFAFGGEIRPGLACGFEGKCDPEIRNLSRFQLLSFFRSFQDFPLVNTGSDAGRAGLRFLKESMRPVEMHEEYSGKQRRSSPPKSPGGSV